MCGWREGTEQVWLEDTSRGCPGHLFVAASRVLPLFVGHSCLWCLITALFWVITLRNSNPEERSSQLLRVGSLKFHIFVTTDPDIRCQTGELQETDILWQSVILQASLQTWCLLKCLKWWTFRRQRDLLTFRCLTSAIVVTAPLTSKIAFYIFIQQI